MSISFEIHATLLCGSKEYDVIAFLPAPFHRDKNSYIRSNHARENTRRVLQIDADQIDLETPVGFHVCTKRANYAGHIGEYRLGQCYVSLNSLINKAKNREPECLTVLHTEGDPQAVLELMDIIVEKPIRFSGQHFNRSFRRCRMKIRGTRRKKAADYLHHAHLPNSTADHTSAIFNPRCLCGCFRS